VSRSFWFRNAAILSAYGGNLANTTFGLPTSRATQVFAFGGPQAFQLGARVVFEVFGQTSLVTQCVTR